MGKMTNLKLVPKIDIDCSLISDVEITNINLNDSPDFVDAFILSASYGDSLMSDEMLDVLNNDSDYVYNQVMKKLYG